MDVLKILAAITGAVIFFTLFLIVLLSPIGYAVCANKWSDYNYSWGLLPGCRVEIEGKMVPSRNVQKVELTSGE